MTTWRKIVKTDKHLAYYFAPESGKLAYGDNRTIEVGKTHTVSCKPKVCEVGLHGSLRAIDALKYAPGNQLYIVEISGDVDIGRDKICGTHRKYVTKVPNSEQLLRLFARKVALGVVLEHYPGINPIVIKYLDSGDERIRYAAWYAASAAARYAARYAASAAARYAARYAASTAAWDAASTAAWDAARYAAWDAARYAARYAADAAWDAARDAQNKLLECMISEACSVSDKA